MVHRVAICHLALLIIIGMAAAEPGEQRAVVGVLSVAGSDAVSAADVDDLTSAITKAAEHSDIVGIVWLTPDAPRVKRAVEEGALDVTAVTDADNAKLGSLAGALGLVGAARVELVRVRVTDRYDRCTAEVRVHWAAPGQARPQSSRIPKRRGEEPRLGASLGESPPPRAELMQFLAEAIIDTFEARLKSAGAPPSGAASEEKQPSAPSSETGSAEEAPTERRPARSGVSPPAKPSEEPMDAVAQAKSLCAAGKHAEAAKILEDAVANRANDPDLLAALGDVYVGMGKPDLALKQYERAAALDLRNVSALVGMAQVYSKKGLWRKAIAAYQRAAETAPDQPAIRVALARAYLENGSLNRALEEYNAALELDPDNGAIHTGLGDVYRKKGDEDRAKRKYIAATKAARPDEKARIRLAEMHEEAGESEAVLYSYAGAGARVPSDEEYRAILSAAEQTLRDQLAKLADILTRFADQHTMVREEAYKAVQAHALHGDELATLLSGIAVPKGYETAADQMIYAFRLSVQSDLDVLSWLDTDDPAVFRRAMALRQECIDELEAVTQQSS